jgi:hypothetical protein
MKTIIESKLFEKQWPAVWTEAEHDEFIDWLAQNPDTGDVIPHTGGVRKVRWKRAGSGKSGGVRVIYAKFDEYGNLILITIYAKSERENISDKEIRRMKNG